MPRYYCDYCDAYLTHDSVRRGSCMDGLLHHICTVVYSVFLLSIKFFLFLQAVVRKQHNSGYKHKSNVKAYYLQFDEENQARLIAELNGFPPVRNTVFVFVFACVKL
jgi:U1 small nuclear ribonucleoprotein C